MWVVTHLDPGGAVNSVGIFVGLDGTTLAVVAIIVLLAIAWSAWKLGRLLWLIFSG